MKYFTTNLLLILIVLVVFVSTFIYVIPAIASVSYSKQDNLNAARAEQYEQYLIRKGYINE